jgi:DNA end-binding protein Ku
VSEAEISMAETLIGALEAEFEPEKYTDGYRERVLELIQRKADGEEITIVDDSAPAASSQVVDLMAALEASVAAAKEARGRHPSAADKKTVAKKSAAKRTASKTTAAKKKKAS